MCLDRRSQAKASLSLNGPSQSLVLHAGHHAGLPAALLPSKGILVGASLPAAGAYDNSAFAENVAVTGGGPPRASLLRQLQPPSLGGYRQLPHHHGPPQ